ncbi:ABC transporter ATP-binding protein [Pseudobacteriovorax antillogorgiicola]|uniref:ABC-type multidrug transport system, ATPase component n=1 Tax=Pseudobacteriovorax antillogorgiicola TaxID=1513793 RepID=A0A1Y6BPF1_9BACT|nr:ABC transporter ATP-binding protein [Pseudobacteriovorax antillogorgiicola]TCS53863.1 ABC-type multidrug transport system ATPase subunit [Pseudobacteriovorax antillogorgiicola]SMF21417.1 ABC-type multidrug transport system, ATPase component [Pseudobacteriovorax antillogorgiicola]
MTSLLQLDHVKLTYPSSKFTLGPIQFHLNKGQCIGIMGENGAGKTTLFQLITGNIKSDEGDIQLNNQKMAPDKFELKRHVGYLPQNLELPKWVSGKEILSYSISLYGLENPEALCHQTLEYWDCLSFSHKPLAACSHGMKKRVALGLATLHEPDLLILDEPFSGLDLYHIRALQNLIQQRKEQGKATFLCTHIAPYTARLCDDLVVLRQGQLTPLDGWKQQDYLQKIQMIEDLFFEQGAPSC